MVDINLFNALTKKISPRNFARLLFWLCLFTVYPVLALSEEGAAKWREDLAFYSTQLKQKHIDVFHSISEKEFSDYLQRIDSSLMVLTEEQVIVELMRLTHRIGDGHTSVPLWNQKSNSLPFEIKIFLGKAYVIATTAEFETLLGSELLSIDGEPIGVVINALVELMPFTDNLYSRDVRVGQYLLNMQILEGLGVVTGGTDIPLSFQSENKKVYIKARPSIKPELPLRLSIRNPKEFNVIEKVSNDFWFATPDKGRTVYINFRHYPSEDAMVDFAGEVLKFINKLHTKNLIIDLRENMGGDFFIGLRLMHSLVLADSIDWKTGVYTLIDNQTFSAAMSNAAQAKQILNAKLIGQPTGGKPTGYQDMGQFDLPNSKLVVTYSKRLYSFQQGKSDAVYPDIKITLTKDDYINSRDKTLDWVLADIELRKKEKRK